MIRQPFSFLFFTAAALYSLIVTAKGIVAAKGADLARIEASLTPEDKVGQLMVIGLEGTKLGPNQRRLLQELKPGGVVIFGRNVRSPFQVFTLLREIGKVLEKEIRPFLATDQEGGAVVRLKHGALVFPGAMLLGAAGNPGLARKAGNATGQDMARLGFNVNLAPVMDVNSRADNPVIGIRSFGDDPDEVAIMGTAFAQGLLAGGILPVAKHFPGHGDTAVDSHGTLPKVSNDLNRLLRVELKPFIKVFDSGFCPIVMTAHVAVPALEKDRAVIPSTLSYNVITSLLRNRLGFNGVVMTDDLGMAALAGIPTGEAAVRALEAGADMLLVSRGSNVQLAVKKAVLDALRKKRLSQERIDSSLGRILKLKKRAGILDGYVKVPFTRRPSRAGKRLVMEVARKGVTMVWNKAGALPVRGKGRVTVLSQSLTFLKDIKRLVPKIEGWSISSRISRPSAAMIVREALRGGDPKEIIVAVTNKRGRSIMDLLKNRVKAPVVLVSLGSPYLLQGGTWADAGIAVYSFRWPACWAAASVVAGRLNPQGKLPVTIPGVAERGRGIGFKKFRAKLSSGKAGKKEEKSFSH
ncbi:MAG: glycoside hydrolase family 3 protein [Deltaproteobacteria bacterium]|nr:glycoside hydrolase family 3 protein [Deltaproteobacteria bacterium]